MKAFVIADQSAGHVQLAEVPVPREGQGELLVRMRAIGVGVHDAYYLPPESHPCLPVGIEGAGEIQRVGDGVANYRAGDRIAFVSSMQAKGGTWAEYAVVDAEALIVQMPPGMSFVEAAALPVAANTALRALARLSDLPSGAHVFIAGGSGAIGTLAIQLAARRGWRVAASASAQNHNFMRALGAELTVDYRDAGWVSQVREWSARGVDAAIAVQPATTADSMRAVKNGGAVVTVSGDTVTPERNITVAMIDYSVDVRSDLTQLVADAVRGQLRLEIERVFRFADAPDALSKVQTRHARGKVVVSLEGATPVAPRASVVQ
ncbi:NADP-dependent oxidoreductase [Leucobacter sp. HY1908]